jgi:hypothetical protein
MGSRASQVTTKIKILRSDVRDIVVAFKSGVDKILIFRALASLVLFKRQ